MDFWKKKFEEGKQKGVELKKKKKEAKNEQS